MKLSSSAFSHNAKIPSKYTCDSDNINMHLKFENVPKDAKSLVLIMDDPDIPQFVKDKMGIDVFDHWVVFNIPPHTTEIKEKSKAPGIEGNNSGGKACYTGPCPPDREHRYFFKLYALDTMLHLKEGASKAEVEEAMEGHVIAHSELIGRYERVKK